MSESTQDAALTRSRLRMVVVLRVIAVGDCAAIVGLFLPAAMMASIHEWIGLGKMPDEPIAEYLARSTSLLYALHGSVLFYLSCSPDRYAEAAQFVGKAVLVCGLLLLAVDQFQSLPTWWQIGEGAIVTGLGAAIWIVSRSHLRNLLSCRSTL